MSKADEMQSMVKEFVAESDEMIGRITIQLGLVERGEHQAETINGIYRDMHTIKGSAQLFGFQQMAQLAHCMEAALDPVRRGKIPLTPEFVDCLYAGLDAVKQILNDIKLWQKEADSTELLTNTLPRLVEIVTRLLGGSIHPFQETLPGEAQGKFGTLTPVSNAVESTATPGSNAATEPSEGTNDTVRVHVDILDTLMNLVGELVLIRNQVIQHTRDVKENNNFVKLSQRLSIVTTELQNEVVRTRMQPVSNVLTRFHRVVRDLSRDLGKHVDLTLHGAETELDKTLIEAIRDPLTHIIRNAVDHGIETPQVRAAAGKPKTGNLSVRSFHEGGQVIIEVTDDGQGLSRERIINKAVERGMLTAEVAVGMQDREVYDLIFAPGFSTAEKISNISGRGVGMDVVRNNIEKIGGTVDLDSVPGRGMSTRLKIPLTLAIVPALIVRASGERFAIPQVKLVELVRLERNSKGHFPGIELLQGSPVFRLRGNLLPIVSLNNTLKIGSDDLEKRDSVNIVVLNGESGYFGLFVDEIVDSTDIVVKPLGNLLKSLRIYSGATVMGDGSVVLALDITGLATMVHMFSDQVTQKRSLDAARNQQDVDKSDFSEYLLVDIGAPGRYVLPLCQVTRLEEFEQSTVRLSGTQRVIRYRDSLLPLIAMGRVLEMGGSQESKLDKLNVVVTERSGRYFGLEVNGILDILASDAPIDSTMVDRPGLLGSLIHDKDVIVVINVHALLDRFIGKPVETRSNLPTSMDRKAKRNRFHILLAEDTNFYRKQISAFLTEAGFQVTIVCDGQEAIDKINRSDSGQFSLVLSDLEMPRLDGLGLVKQVRENAQHRTLPVIALTTKSRDSDRDEGLRAGFTAYLEKLNKDTVLEELDRTLKIA